jgi:hypothetical protein
MIVFHTPQYLHTSDRLDDERIIAQAGSTLQEESDVSVVSA